MRPDASPGAEISPVWLAEIRKRCRERDRWIQPIIIAEKLKSRLSDKIPLIDLHIFGSRARGDGDNDSDMDVFLEVESLDRNQKETIHELTWETGLEFGLVISPLIFTREEIKNSPLRSSPVLVNIFREGVIV